MMKTCFAISLLIVAAVADAYGQQASKLMKQPRKVLEAYQVVTEFRRLFAEDLNFERAFEATFTKDAARRRAIAIAESEIGGVAVEAAEDATLLSIYKSQTQLFFLLLPLANPKDTAEAALLLPPEIRTIFDRKRPSAPEQLPSYAAQLNRDVEQLRAHINQLAAQHAAFADRIREIKEQLLLKKLETPTEVVKPLTSYSRGKVLRPDEQYYQIDDYAVIREGGEMKIVGIRLFYRMF